MRFLTICKIFLIIFPCVVFAIQEYTVKLEQRGIVFADEPNGKLTEAQLCSSIYCIYIESEELELLDIDLDNNTQGIFNSLNSMS